MKFVRRDTNILENKELTRDLQNVLSNISLDNTKHEIIEGEISSDQVFKHGLKTRPSMWLPIEGDVFIPFGGMQENQVTVSPKTAGKFKLALIK